MANDALDGALARVRDARAEIDAIAGDVEDFVGELRGRAGIAHAAHRELSTDASSAWEPDDSVGPSADNHRAEAESASARAEALSFDQLVAHLADARDRAERARDAAAEAATEAQRAREDAEHRRDAAHS